MILRGSATAAMMAYIAATIDAATSVPSADWPLPDDKLQPSVGVHAGVLFTVSQADDGMRVHVQSEFGEINANLSLYHTAIMSNLLCGQPAPSDALPNGVPCNE